MNYYNYNRTRNIIKLKNDFKQIIIIPTILNQFYMNINNIVIKIK